MPMLDAVKFISLLSKYTKTDTINMEDVLFGGGLDLSSIGFTEFIMELEEEYDIDIDADDLDASIKTVGQLYDRLKEV